MSNVAARLQGLDLGLGVFLQLAPSMVGSNEYETIKYQIRFRYVRPRNLETEEQNIKE